MHSNFPSNDFTCFATDLLHAFDEIRQRGEQSAGGCERLLSMIRQRATVEKSYAKDLQKCASVEFGIGDQSSLGEALESLKSHLINKSVQHSQFAEHLMTDVFKPLMDVKVSLTTRGKALVAEVVKLQRSLKSLEQKYCKTQNQYRRAYKDIGNHVLEATRIGVSAEEMLGLAYPKELGPSSTSDLDSTLSPEKGPDFALEMEPELNPELEPQSNQQLQDTLGQNEETNPDPPLEMCIINESAIQSAGEIEVGEASSEKESDIIPEADEGFIPETGETVTGSLSEDYLDESSDEDEDEEGEREDESEDEKQLSGKVEGDESREEKQLPGKDGEKMSFSERFNPAMRSFSPLKGKAKQKLSSAVQVLGGINKKDIPNFFTLFPSLDKRKEDKLQGIRNSMKTAERLRRKCIELWEVYTNLEKSEAHDYQCVLTGLQQIEESFLKEMKDGLRKQLVLESSALANQQYDVQMLFKVMDDINVVEDLQLFISENRDGEQKSLGNMGLVEKYAVTFPSVCAELPRPPGSYPVKLPVDDESGPVLLTSVVRKVELFDKKNLVQALTCLKDYEVPTGDDEGTDQEKQSHLVAASIVANFLNTEAKPFSKSAYASTCLLWPDHTSSEESSAESTPAEEEKPETVQISKSEDDSFLDSQGPEVRPCMELLHRHPQCFTSDLCLFQMLLTQDPTEHDEKLIHSVISNLLQEAESAEKSIDNLKQVLKDSIVCSHLISSIFSRISSERSRCRISQQHMEAFRSLLHAVLDVALTDSNWTLAQNTLIVSFRIQYNIVDEDNEKSGSEDDWISLHTLLFPHPIWQTLELWSAVLDSILSVDLTIVSLSDKIESILSKDASTKSKELRISQLAFWTKVMKYSGIEHNLILGMVDTQLSKMTKERNFSIDECYVIFLHNTLLD